MNPESRYKELKELYEKLHLILDELYLEGDVVLLDSLEAPILRSLLHLNKLTAEIRASNDF